MRSKVTIDNQSKYTCCFCCHVRVGTILLGIVHLMVHLMVLSIFAVYVVHPELFKDTRPDQFETSLYDNDDGFQNQENESMSTIQLFRNGQKSEDKCVGVLVALGSLFVTVLLLYGSIRGRAGYVLPFFCVQAFDFGITCLTILSYLSYIHEIKTSIAAQDSMIKDQLLQMDDTVLMVVVFLLCMLIIFVKAYLCGMVWACYQYLVVTSGTVTSRVVSVENGSEDSENLLPPKYEDAIMMIENEPAPPPYRE